MPIVKFRDVSHMTSPRLEPGDPRLIAAIRECWAVADRTLQPRFPAGVHKLRSWDELVALEEKWHQENFARYRAQIKAAEDRNR